MLSSYLRVAERVSLSASLKPCHTAGRLDKFHVHVGWSHARFISSVEKPRPCATSWQVTDPSTNCGRHRAIQKRLDQSKYVQSCYLNTPRLSSSLIHYRRCSHHAPSFMSTTSAPTGKEVDKYRLPTNVKPTHYDVTVKTDLEAETFAGLVKIK